MNAQCNQYFNNEQFNNCSRTLKGAGKYAKITKCFSRIKDITTFDRKFKENPWRSRSFGNLS